MPVDHRGLGTYYESLSVVELLLEYHHHLIMLIINWFRVYKLVYKVASLDTQLECIDSNLESGRYISRVRSAKGFLSGSLSTAVVPRYHGTVPTVGGEAYARDYRSRVP